MFAILLWLFVAQWALIGAMLGVSELSGTTSLVGTMSGIALFTTAFIPFIALPISLAVILAMMT